MGWLSGNLIRQYVGVSSRMNTRQQSRAQVGIPLHGGYHHEQNTTEWCYRQRKAMANKVSYHWASSRQL